jgi:hypothetical protein
MQMLHDSEQLQDSLCADECLSGKVSTGNTQYLGPGFGPSPVVLHTIRTQVRRETI